MYREPLVFHLLNLLYSTQSCARLVHISFRIRTVKMKASPYWRIQRIRGPGQVDVGIGKWARIMGQPFEYRVKRTDVVDSKYSGCTETITS